MKFWPLSVIASSSMVPPEYAQELRDFCYRMPSEGAYYAAKVVAQQMQPVQAPNLVIIETPGGPARRAYTGYPESPEWLCLERATVMENDDGYLFVLLDAMH